MTATVHDLTARRVAQSKPPVVFDDDVAALRFIAQHLDHLRAEANSSLLIPSASVDLTLGQVRAVVDACLSLYVGEHKEDR